MVIVKLMGGLGNQMFQYAAGRRLANFKNSNLKIDLSWFDNVLEVNTFRAYGLDKFAIQEDFATREKIEALTVRKRSFIERVVIKAMGRKPGAAPSYIREKQFHFDPEIMSLPDDIYLEGYWQSEKYFADIEGIIRPEFTVKTSQEGKNCELADMIASCASVSLHIRRGDYVSNPEASRVHGICNLDYYYRCVEQLIKIVKKPHFFVFSDDHDWVRDNLKLSYPITPVDHNGSDKDYEDLRLMSQCRHNIIANSTFSWWGAWLNESPDKVVIAPERWFNDSSRDTKDLIPDNWIRI